ncbi:Type 1 glutamine amidotransferase-like domain-containing protein [Goodfellowiella coeruleoviolacea]|uniref:Peptidase E n=1 Tax=Goodfellowiella coeruleoviolacea TaxID=334858 RepID=A0AAE3GDE3_9PSEU|nr:peptidase E [Goodfellowiella coeruleoviolacea]MCP2165194.1 Peptidase E [Goodfellowiella coeruleoviolacea]
MAADHPTILATSGGWRSGHRTQLEFGPLIHHAIALSGVTGRRPRLCHVGTAGGDQLYFNAWVDEAARVAGVEVSHLNLFPMPPTADLADFVLGNDVVWVNGGSVANLLAVWRVHGLDAVLRRAWQAGVVLGGVSAGSICWFTGGTTDSFGPELRVVTNGLGLLPYGNGVHFDSEAARRPAVHAAVASGELPATYCTDDGAGLHFRGTELVEAVAERPTAGAYLVERDAATGVAVESALEVRRL